MSTLVRSILDRDIELNGVRHVVRSPTVREALQILASAKGTLAGEDVQRTIFFDTLKAWLPEPLFEAFTQRDYPEERVVAFAFKAVNEGVPEFTSPDDEDEDSKDVITDPNEIDWSSVVADYMSAYSISLSDAMSEPWNGFLLMSKRADMVRARASLRTLSDNGIAYIKDDKEREKAIEDLVRRAGGQVKTDEEKREELLAKQQASLDQLSLMFASAGMGKQKGNA